MKSRSSLVRLALIVLLSCSVLRPLCAQQSLRVDITYTDERRQVGVLLNANAQSILFALQEGAPGQQVPISLLKAIVFPDAAQITQGGRAAYLSGDWEAAATIMGQIADAFPQAALIANNFAAEARFYQIDSLRRLGRYSEMGRLFQTPTGTAMEAVLAEVFVRQVALFKLWAYYGANNIDQLGAELEAYLKPQVGDDKMLPDAMFQDGLAGSDLVQLTFLRGKVHEAAGRSPQAIEDYYRTFTLTQGNQPVLAREAMTAAMALHVADPALEEKASKKWPLQSLAFLFKNAFNQGEIDAAFADFAVMPELPVAPVAPKEEEPAPEAEPAPAPAPKDGADADKKPADKAKGKGESGKDDKAKAKGKGKGKGEGEAAPK